MRSQQPPAAVRTARGRVWRALAVVAAMASVAGCAATGTSGSPSPVAGERRLTVPDAEVAYPRTHQAARLLEAHVVTTREADAAVTAAVLDSPLFANSPSRGVDSGNSPVRLSSNRANRVRVPLGTPVCPAQEGASRVVLTLTVDGVESTEVLNIDDTLLREINADECEQQALLDVATPVFGAVESQSATEMVTSVVLTRGEASQDQPVTLTSMTGNIVFAVTLGEAPRTLDPGEASVAVPAVVRVGRCDPHVFAESKKTFVFPVYLAVGGAEPGYVEMQPTAAMQAALQQLFDDCAVVTLE